MSGSPATEVPVATSDAEVVAGWRDAGVVILRSVFDAQRCAAVAQACEAAVDAAAATDSADWRFRYKRASYGGVVVDRLDPIRDFAPQAVPLLDDGRLVALASLVVGAPVSMYKDKYISKRPGTGGYGLHQDIAYTWQLCLEPDQLVQFQIALGPHRADNGAVEVAPGWHDRLLSAPGAEESIEPGVVPEEALQPLLLDAGDVALLHYLAPHRSPANTGDRARPLLAPSFAQGGPDVWDRYYAGYQRRAESETADLLGRSVGGGVPQSQLGDCPDGPDTPATPRWVHARRTALTPRPRPGHR
ncbi:MAG: phytanoyl-CoA dioxygenase family protein [Microthrixaceae bacterium]